MLAQNSVPLLHELFPEKAFSEGKDRPIAVSYTHLDVYKRQDKNTLFSVIESFFIVDPP